MSMSQENLMAPGLSFSTIEMVDCIEYIIEASPSSIRWKKSCSVNGGLDKSKKATQTLYMT